MFTYHSMFKLSFLVSGWNLMTVFLKILHFALILSSALTISACAGKLPVPGAHDTVNQSFFVTRHDLLERLSILKVNMSEQEVFSILGHEKEDLIRLERDKILSALYGTNSINLQDGLPEKENFGAFIQSLSGLSLNYKIVERKHGFSSPIRIRTDEKGFDYTVTLVFRDGFLLVPPFLTGGLINKSHSSTFFDHLDPHNIIDRSGL